MTNAVPELKSLECLVVDCQATGANPSRGSILELGWARVRTSDAKGLSPSAVNAQVLRLPQGESIPKAVTRVTGVDQSHLEGAVDPAESWRALEEMAKDVGGPLLIHYARFELPFLRALRAESLTSASVGTGDQIGMNSASELPDTASFPFSVRCTHEIACRLLPELPRRGLHALAGYFGYPVDKLRRCANHVAATAYVWAHLVDQLDQREGIRDVDALDAWMARPKPKRTPGRSYPMPRSTRLGLPDKPGVYRMLRSNGDVLYVGKASSLKSRVNSYFRKRSRVPDRTLEMLTQAQGLKVSVTSTPLEAAMLEFDEIRRLSPPYNVALVDRGQELSFAASDFSSFSKVRSSRHRTGPLAGCDTLTAFSLLTECIERNKDRVQDTGSQFRVLDVPEEYALEVPGFSDGLALVRHRVEQSGCGREPMGATWAGRGLRGRLLSLGSEQWVVWRQRQEAEKEEKAQRRLAGAADLAQEDEESETEEGETDSMPDWTPQQVERALLRVLRRSAWSLRQSRWLRQLANSELRWDEGALRVTDGRLCLSLDNGFEGQNPGSGQVGQEWIWDRQTYDRLRVLTAEIRRIVAQSSTVNLTFQDGRKLAGARLQSALYWI